MKASWRKEHLCGFFNDCCSCCWIMERGREEKSTVDNKEENAAGSRWHATLNASVGCGAYKHEETMGRDHICSAHRGSGWQHEITG